MENVKIEKKETENKKQSREEKLREAKIEDQLTKSIVSLQNPDEKVNSLIKKYVELEKESRKLTTSVKQNDRRLELVQKEKENLQQEYNKAILNKSKLESLCRELQRQNKSIKDESLSKIREEEEKRKETQAKFQKALNEITIMMNENNEKNKKLQDDNVEMTKKFKYLLEQYEIREQQVSKINKQMDLAAQLNDAKLAKAQMEATLEKETLLKEKQDALSELKRCKETLLELQSKERLLKEQVDLYTEKYDEFQDSLTKSNTVFTTYKSEMEKMSKKIVKLEKECNEWRLKFEKSNIAVLDLASERQVRDQILSKTTRQLSQLQKLCRTLQAERATLIQALKDNNIERPPMPEIPPQEPEPIDLCPINKEDDKLDIMSKNCAELKQNLANLQSQLSSLTGAEKKKTLEQETKRTKNKNKKKNTNKIVNISGESTEIKMDEVNTNQPEPVEEPEENSNHCEQNNQNELNELNEEVRIKDPVDDSPTANVECLAEIVDNSTENSTPTCAVLSREIKTRVLDLETNIENLSICTEVNDISSSVEVTSL